MTYSPLPPGLTTAPLEGPTIPPSYKSPTSDAPPPAYFPPSRSPSPQPPVYTSPGRPNHDTNSHWTRFPSSSPPKPSPQKPQFPCHPPSATENRHTRSSPHAPPGYLSGKLNPAPKKHRHRHSLGHKPDIHTSDHCNAHFPTSQPPPSSHPPYRLRSPSPCRPTHSAPARIVLNVGVETELDTEAERRHQYISSAKHRYDILADESDLVGEERGLWGERYGDRCRSGRGAMVAWWFLLVVSMAVVVVVVVVLR